MACLEHALWMHQAGLKITLLALSGSELEKQGLKRGLSVKTISRSGYFRPFQSWTCTQWLRKEAPDFLCFHQLKDLWLFGPLLPRLKHIQLIAFSHTTIGLQKKSFVYKFLYSSLSRAIALTEFHKNNLLAMTTLNPEKIAVIPNPVDTSKYRPDQKSQSWRSQFAPLENEVLLGLIGRLDPQKGQLETLKALDLVWSRGVQNWQLIVVGEDTKNTPGTEMRLKDFLKDKPYRNRVHFLGYQEDIPKIMASLDLFILPSFGETFGRVVIESMASGTPVLASQAGGVPELLGNGKYGFLFTSKSIVSLQQQLEALIKDKDLRTSLVNPARESCLKTYSQSEVQRQILQLLSSSL